MLKIKLYPKGKKHQITYRIVVSEARSKYNGKFTDDIGFYIPQTKTLNVDTQKLEQWIKNGAQVTLGVDRLLNPDKHPRIKKAKVAKEAKVEEPKTEASKDVETTKTESIDTTEKKVDETPTETPAETPVTQ
jgi:small subunit ribosomal protein S16